LLGEEYKKKLVERRRKNGSREDKMVEKIKISEFERLAQLNLAEDCEAIIGGSEYYYSPVFGPIRIFKNKVFKRCPPPEELIFELEEED